MRRFAVVTVLSVLCFANAGAVSAETFFPLSKNGYANPTSGIQLCSSDATGGCDAVGGGDVGCGGAVCGSPGGSCCCCGGGYGGGGSLVFDYDIMFMKYHQSGGVKSVIDANIVGNDDSAEFDFEYSPRVSLGYELCNGLGYRINYWYFDESAPTNNAGFVSIDTYTFDAEIYRRLDLSACTSLEFSGGYRYLDFEQRDETDLDWGFTNWGGTISTELNHQVTCNSRIFVRSRFSIVMGDVGLTDEGNLVDLPGVGVDHETTMIELALGWEATRCMCNGLTLVYGLSGHWWQWSDAAIAADSSDEAYLTDAGFAGFAFRVGLEY